jgi:hypothetical protein
MTTSEQHLSPEEWEAMLTSDVPSEKIKNHVKACSECQALLTQWQALRSSCVKVDGDLMVRRVRQALVRRSRQRRFLKSAVAMVGLGFGLYATLQTSYMNPHLPEPVVLLEAMPEQGSIQRSLQWLMSARESDGRWSAQRWGGLQKFDVAVTSLALLPILEKKSIATTFPLRPSIEFLLSQQRVDGGFGPKFLGDIYNHCMACLVLLKAQGIFPKDVPTEAIDSALAFLVQHQGPEGGFDYQQGLPAELALSLWAKDVLDLAQHVKPPWQEPHRRLEAWLAHKASGAAVQSGTFAAGSSRHWMLQYAQGKPVEVLPLQIKEPLTRDIYQAYYCYRSLNASMSTEAKRLLEQLQTQLLDQQEADGEVAGSWPADGQWGRVGGRVYNTGVALLCLIDRY